MPRPTSLCFMPEHVSARGSAGSVVHGFVALFGVSSAKGWRGDLSFPGWKTPWQIKPKQPRVEPKNGKRVCGFWLMKSFFTRIFHTHTHTHTHTKEKKRKKKKKREKSLSSLVVLRWWFDSSLEFSTSNNNNKKYRSFGQDHSVVSLRVSLGPAAALFSMVWGRLESMACGLLDLSYSWSKGGDRGDPSFPFEFGNS